MKYGSDATEAYLALLYMVIFALLLHAGLQLWVDCGKPCGASGKTQAQQTTNRTSGSR